MDSLLRAAIHRRELEAALLSIDGDPEALHKCIGCGKRCSEVTTDPVCSTCGRSQQAKDEATSLYARTRRAQLERLSLQLDELAKEDPLADERMCKQCGRKMHGSTKGVTCRACRALSAEPPKQCTRPGCNRALRADNRRGVCADVKVCGGVSTSVQPPAAEAPAVEPALAIAADGNETLRRFRLLAEALGFSPDEVLAEFAQTWLDRAQRAVRPPAIRAAASRPQPTGVEPTEDAA